MEEDFKIPEDIFTGSSGPIIVGSPGVMWENTPVGWKTVIVKPNNEKEVITFNENQQKEINKIGITGKRTIDDLLIAFKTVKSDKSLIVVDDLENKQWVEDVFKGDIKDGLE